MFIVETSLREEISLGQSVRALGSDIGRLNPPSPANNYMAWSKSLEILELLGPYLQNGNNKTFLAGMFSYLKYILIPQHRKSHLIIGDCSLSCIIILTLVVQYR